MEKEILSLVAQLNKNCQQALALYTPEVERLIQSGAKDDNTICHLLDGLLDFAFDEKMLLLFKKLCRYYWDINPRVTADYVNAYREMWDSETEDLED